MTLTVGESPAVPWSLSLRLPGWSRGHALSLNGADITPGLDNYGYLAMTRRWQAGDVLSLRLPLDPQFIMPHPRIDALRGCVALHRGPLLYCLESHDQPDGAELLDVQVLTEEPLTVTAVPLLGGIHTITVPGRVLTSDWSEMLYRPLAKQPASESRVVSLTAVPYYAWANRGMRSMRVWMPVATSGNGSRNEDEASVRPGNLV